MAIDVGHGSFCCQLFRYQSFCGLTWHWLLDYKAQCLCIFHGTLYGLANFNWMGNNRHWSVINLCTESRSAICPQSAVSIPQNMDAAGGGAKIRHIFVKVARRNINLIKHVFVLGGFPIILSQMFSLGTFDRLRYIPKLEIRACNMRRRRNRDASVEERVMGRGPPPHPTWGSGEAS